MPKQIHNPASSPPPVGPYSVATEANGFVFLSGQVGADPATGDSVGDDVGDQAHRVMQTIGTVLADLGLGYEDIVKTTVFLADMADYATVNEIYAGYVGVAPPARSAFGVAALPAGYRVEIEVIAAR